MLLDVKQLRITFDTHRGTAVAVDGIDLGLERGKTLCIVGESGCGKSVTALSLLGLLSKSVARVTGSIRFNDVQLDQLNDDGMRRIRGNDIAMIFQEPMTSLNPVLSVCRQVEESLKWHRIGMTAADRRDRVRELFRLVGIPDGRLDDFPHEMSGGMRQRVMIAMALACEPKLLIADEPTTALDVTIQAQILDLIRGLKERLGMGVILITHDLGIVHEMADDVIVMYAGKVVERTKSDGLFKDPLHPYTQGLLSCLPDDENGEDGKKAGTLQGIPGTVPSIFTLPRGCYFQERCRWVKAHCLETDPPLEEKRTGHSASCFEVKKC